MKLNKPIYENKVGQRNMEKRVINDQLSNYFINSKHDNITAPVDVHYIQESINTNLTGMVFKENVCLIYVKCLIWICELFYLKYSHVDFSLYQFSSEPQHVGHTIGYTFIVSVTIYIQSTQLWPHPYTYIPCEICWNDITWKQYSS